MYVSLHIYYIVWCIKIGECHFSTCLLKYFTYNTKWFLAIKLFFFQFCDRNIYFFLLLHIKIDNYHYLNSSQSDRYRESNLEKKQRIDTKNEANKISDNFTRTIEKSRKNTKIISDFGCTNIIFANFIHLFEWYFHNMYCLYIWIYLNFVDMFFRRSLSLIPLLICFFMWIMLNRQIDIDIRSNLNVIDTRKAFRLIISS